MSEICARIVALLRTEGLELDSAGWDCLLAGLEEDDPARGLVRLAADPEAGENAPFVALLFSPGAAAQRVLEPALATAGPAGTGLDAAGAAALADAVAGSLAGARLPVRLPNGGAGEYPAAAEDLHGYVRRLAPAAAVPNALRAALARHDPEMAARLGVVLRHSGLDWTPAREFFLATLLDRAEDGEIGDLPELVAWSVDFLDIEGPAFAPRRALAARRAALTAQLRQARDAERISARGNFETCSAQGVRSGYAHAPDVRRALALLDRACRLVLGVPGAALAAGPRTFDPAAADAVALLRLLP